MKRCNISVNSNFLSIPIPTANGESESVECHFGHLGQLSKIPFPWQPMIKSTKFDKIRLFGTQKWDQFGSSGYLQEDIHHLRFYHIVGLIKGQGHPKRSRSFSEFVYFDVYFERSLRFEQGTVLTYSAQPNLFHLKNFSCYCSLLSCITFPKQTWAFRQYRLKTFVGHYTK